MCQEKKTCGLYQVSSKLWCLVVLMLNATLLQLTPLYVVMLPAYGKRPLRASFQEDPRVAAGLLLMLWLRGAPRTAEGGRPGQAWHKLTDPKTERSPG